MTMMHNAAPLPGEDREETAFSPSRWEGGFLEEDDEEEFKHAAADLLEIGKRSMAELLKIGTRVMCRSMNPWYRHQRQGRSFPDLTFGRGDVQHGWIVKVGELELGRQIGQGSVGAVYKGMHIPSGRAVAVKVRKPPNPSHLRLREAERDTECCPLGC
jgi:hypothetical protein